MLNNYTFLSDHSYSLQPVSDENDELPLNQREGKNKKRRRSSNRTNGVVPTNTRTVSIDRSSSDKENNSITNNTLISAITNSRNKRNKQLNKKTSTESLRTRVSTRITATNSRSKLAKKHDNKNASKIPIKSTSGHIVKKKKVNNNNNNNNNRSERKLLNVSQMESSDPLPSLSIEERVKLRRTKPLPPPTVPLQKVKSTKINKSKSNSLSSLKTSLKKSNKKKSQTSTSTIKNKKLFLGSGLDLDNIVLGNRQRRCVQT